MSAPTLPAASQRAVARLARELDSLQRQVRALATQPQLAYSSFEGGAISEYATVVGADGEASTQLVTVIGEQHDGTHGAITVAGPPVPTPAPATIEAVPGGVLIRWDGTWDESPTTVAPMTFAHVEVHADSDPALTAELFDTKRGEIVSARGGELLVPAGPDVGVYARLVARTSDGKRSEASVTIGPVAAGKLPAAALDYDLDALQARADQAVTDAQTARQAAETAEATAGAVSGQAATAQQAADDAATSAQAALERAQTAQSTGTSAQQAADAARSAATAAREAADAAGTTAAQADAAAADAAAKAAQAIADAQAAAQAASAADQKATAAQSRADTAVANAADAQATADGKVRSFFQAAAPTGLVAGDVGDLWFDTDDGNKMYRWSGTAWVASDDTRIAAAVTAAANANTAAGNAQTAANSKIVTFYQAAAPATTGRTTGDLWVDTDDGNRLYRWSGTAWTDVRDTTIATAQTTAGTALTTATGRNRIFVQATKPSGTGYVIGDLWVDTANGRRLSSWDPTAASGAGDWVLQQLGNAALAAKSINAGDVLVDGTVTAALLKADAVDGKTITGALLRTAITGNRLELDSTFGLRGFASDGTTVRTRLSTDGYLTAAGATITGTLRTADSGARIEMAQKTGAAGSSGSLLLHSGVNGTNPAGISYDTAFTDQGGGSVVVHSSTLKLSGGATAGKLGPSADLVVREAAAGGYESVFAVTTDRFTVNGVDQLTDSGWIVVPTINGFATNNGGLQVRKIGNRVSCRYGYNATGLSLGTDSVVAILPDGFRPPGGFYGLLATNNAANTARGVVDNSGAVHVVPGGSAISSFYRFDALTWLVN